ncbi:MAG: ATPase, T2SS/T4P/T4SS family, partial [Mariprofundus sp.]
MNLLKYQRQLIQSGAATEDQLAEAEMSGNPSLLTALLEMDDIDDDLLLDTLAQLYKTPYVDVSKRHIKPELLTLCTEDLCAKYAFIPLQQSGTDIQIATASPLNAALIDDLAFKLGRRIITRFARPDMILSKITELFKDGAATFDMTMSMNGLEDEPLFTQSDDQGQEKEQSNLDELKRGAEDSPIIKLVNNIIIQAMSMGSSDIHIEPGEKQSVVRLRVDGRLRAMMHFPARVHQVVASRVKIMSKLDISNTRTPQDGRARIRMKNKGYDMRISTLPAMHGEKVVMRILDHSGLALDLDALCFEKLAYKNILQCIQQPTGAVLVTGPTGSGKTTTLYSFLHHINDEEMNLITVEDPVEFQIEGISQVQVNTKTGMTFAAALRSILRQDPDVVMVGEIRDNETAEIALHAAQTGHLVLSTLHTNDAPSTITRLLDMGIEANMLASSLNLIVAQRLVRRLCPHCRTKSKPAADLALRLGIPDDVTVYDKVGCKQCNDIGYKGRIGIHEVLHVSENIRKLIARGAQDRELMKVAREEGMLVLFEDGMAKVLAGQTSLQEILRLSAVPEGFKFSEHLDDHGLFLSFADIQQHRRDNAYLPEATDQDQKIILIVDDSPSVCQLVEFILEAEGYKVVQAADGQQAWDILQQMKPGLVLSDCNMPEVSGMELLKMIREEH